VLIEREEWRRKKLIQLTECLKKELQSLRWKLLLSVTPIQPVIIGEGSEVVQISNALREQGFLIPAIRPPTVPQGSARLRISLSALHNIEDVKQLAMVLRELE
jgi:8-amino-7-oxononanoate synthase